MYTIHNTLDDKIIFEGSENDFIHFVKKIAVENEDFDYSVLGVSDAIEYIEDYCDNLELTEGTVI